MNIHAATLPAAAQSTVTPALSIVLARLRALIADRLVRTAFAPLILPLCQYLKRVELRFARHAIRHAAGTFGLPAPAPRPRRPAARPAPRAASPPFPRARAWFLAALKHEAAYIRLRLEAFLAEPETAALLGACPRAAGTLRYVFLMLGMPDPRPRGSRPRPQPIPPAPSPAPAPLAIGRASAPRPAMAAEPCPRAAALWPFHPDRIRSGSA